MAEKVIKVEEDDVFASDMNVEPDNHALSAKRRKVPSVGEKSTKVAKIVSIDLY